MRFGAELDCLAHNVEHDGKSEVTLFKQRGELWAVGFTPRFWIQREEKGDHER